jgi:hypothetical protein
MTRAMKKGHEREWRELHNEEPNDLYSSPHINIEKNVMDRGM